jgi:hypothetical protein
MRSTRGRGLALPISAALLVLSAAIHAQDKQTVGAMQITLGWGDEPAFAGSRNSIDVGVSDGSGAPVVDQTAMLSVDLSFGERRLRLPLLPVERQPGLYRAWIVPSRAGSYAFHVTGRLKGEAIDITSGCSEKTFACVTEPGELQFPEKDPSAGQLADSLSQSQARVQHAIDEATDARMISLAALAMSAGAVAVSVLIRSLRSGRSRKSLDRMVAKGR